MKSILNIKLRLFFVAVLLLGGLSCSRERGPDIKDETITISQFCAQYTEIEVGDETKTEVGSVNYKDYWNIGDELAVVNVTQGYRVDKYQSTTRVINDSEGLGVFTAVDAPAGGYTYESSDIIFVAYPYAAISKVDDGGVIRLTDNKLTVTMTNNLSYTSKSNSPMFAQNDIQVTNLMNAGTLQSEQANVTGITFNRLVALIRVLSHVSTYPLNQEQVISLTVKAKKLSGTADVVFSGNTVGSTPSISPNSGTSDAFTVELPGRPKMGSTTTIAEFIPIFPIWMGNDATHNGYAVVYETDNYYVGFHRERDATFGGDSVLAWMIFEGTYSQVPSEASADGDFKWWYSPKTDADLEGGSQSGSYTDGGDLVDPN